VLGLVARGYSNKEIAKALYLSGNTVKTYLRRVFEKLQVNDRQEAADKVYKQSGLGNGHAEESLPHLARTGT
jgi:DNA-binding NarL/FixJ family response regulator